MVDSGAGGEREGGSEVRMMRGRGGEMGRKKWGRRGGEVEVRRERNAERERRVPWIMFTTKYGPCSSNLHEYGALGFRV